MSVMAAFKMSWFRSHSSTVPMWSSGMVESSMV